MDERGQRKAIKHAQSCVIGDANRWMLQKEFHHLLMRCQNQSCDGVNKCCRCYKEHSNAYTQSKPGREHRFKINSFACHSECKVQLKNAPWWSRKMPPPPV